MDTKEHDPHSPRSLEDMAGAAEWAPLSALIKGASPPHIIISGGAGIGKSLAARLILDSSVALWLRCSQDPTLKIDNRDKIKATARRRVQESTIHWIVLEHADLLHSDAQAFLRRIIETSTGASRFILETRNLSAISEPLMSRATLFNAPILQPYEIRSEIIRRNPAVSIDVADRLAVQAEGNIRWATLQGLGGSDGFHGFLAADLQMDQIQGETKWARVLRVMEALQTTGSYPKAAIGGTGWERPGGVCPWAVAAKTLQCLN